MSLVSAREVARKDCAALDLFFCACDVFTFVILTGPVWFDDARARTCLGSLCLSCDRCFGLFVFVYSVRWLWYSANMFDSNVLLNFYNELANRSALQLARWVCLPLVLVRVRRDGRCNLGFNECLIRLSPSVEPLGEVNRFTLDGGLRNRRTARTNARGFSTVDFARIQHTNKIHR